MEEPTIIVDTREQEGYSFSLPSVRKKLEAGDYSIVGFEEKVAVERKSLPDFIQTIIRERKRFYKELEKLSKYSAACIVVEANFRDLIEGHYRSGAHANALIGAVASISVGFIPVYFCSDRQASCRFVEEFLIHFYRKTLTCNNQQTRTESGEE